MEKIKEYNIGLDIGVGSVGWCITDENENIIKRNGKNLWGSRIFNEAETAATRRNFRTSRRRLDRRKERIKILQSLIYDDMEKQYPNFFQLLKESSLDFDDKATAVKIDGVKYNLFCDGKENNDSTYYNKFPTIYHLRKYLIDTQEKVDIRLVYLAIHHIIKYRGNFLYEGEFSNNTNEVFEKIDLILDYLKENSSVKLIKNKNEFINIMTDKNKGKSNKKDELIKCFYFDKEDKQLVVNIINAFLGYVFELNKIFEIDDEIIKLNFSKEIEDLDEIILKLTDEETNVYEAIKNVYSWYILQEILNGKSSISDAMIEKYNKYSNDLKKLKDMYKVYLKNEYNLMFKKYNKNNYVAYTGKSAGKTYKKCNPEDFFSNIKKVVLNITDEYKEKQEILKDIDDNNFLRIINVTQNGEIPYQLHKNELVKILENQSKYYKTIEENKENIIKLFEFKIPYYVGPLAKNNSKWSWIIRKSNETIRPWNFEQVVDEDLTAEEFIKRMTNKCTYILNEDVIPKQSILYSYFCVLNELNNVRINGRHIAKDTKKRIIETLFINKKRVSKKMIIDFYKIEGIKIETIEGLQDTGYFMSNMSSYIDFKNIFGKVDESNYELCEKLIYWLTIFEEKKIIKRRIKKEYPNLDEDITKRILKLKYTGWARLSKKLLLGIKSNDNESIMEKLENSSMNFMKIINEKNFGFMERIEELNPKNSEKIRYKDIADLPTSPANKRAIWQSICIVKELEKVMKKKPKNIFIEFARSEENNKNIKDSRTTKLLKKYEEIDKQIKELKNYDNVVYKELKKHQNEKILKEKLYLYYIQNGKCMYSGKTLNIDELDKYEVDHIIPRSYIKDDGLDNKALVIREENQRKKDNLLLSDEIINERSAWWKSLLDVGLISTSKYYRLIRRRMFETDSDRDKFIKRQLVETRQIIKYVANLLKNEDDEIDIYTIRGELTHNFREKYKLYKNRNVNNYHHAQDAYIISIIGNELRKNWRTTEEFKYSEYVKAYLKNEKSKDEKNGIILGVINKHIDIEKIKKVMQYKDCYISNMLEERTGEFYKQTLYSPKDNPTIALKKNKDVKKYGGYTGEQKAYCIIFTYLNNKNKREYQLVGIPIQIAYRLKKNKLTLENYIKESYLEDKIYSNFEILRDKILINQEYIDENNETMKLCSDSEIRVCKPLIVNEKFSKLIYLNNKKELDDQEKELLINNYQSIFDYLIEKLEKEYKCFESVYKKIQLNYNNFERINNEQKKNIINGLIDLMSRGQGNLKELGLTEREGRKSGQNFKTKRLLNMTFLDKSITGIYERKYKVDGLENNSSK